MLAGDVVEIVERFAPPDLAADWDNSGWQVGTAQQEVTGVLLALDATMDVVEEAVRLGANLLIAHHPLFFRPLARLDVTSYLGRLIKRLLVDDIGVYAAHTNLDVVSGGISDVLAQLMGLEDARCLRPLPGPLDSGELGWGRVGGVRSGVSTEQLTVRAQSALGAPRVRVTHGDRDLHNTIAVCGGSGADLIADAASAGATLYLTGEIKYHEAQRAAQMGLTVVEVGHFYSERPGMDRLAQSLADAVEVHVSEVNTSPFG